MCAAADTGLISANTPVSTAVTTTDAAASPLRAWATVTGWAKRACTASEWVVTTGTRTQVADTFRSGMPRILRDSLRTLSSSELHPSAFNEPAHGTTFIASGAGNGDCSGS